MAEPYVQRRLAAILAADVVGYSRIMEADEAGTHARLNRLREELFDHKIAEHHGRLVKTTGDGLLIEFTSAVDAVRCAVEIQRDMGQRNSDLPAYGRVDYRIGVNLGDIIVDDDDIYGNGVNVAARLEALAEPGGICISGRVLDQVEKNVEVGFAYLGRQTVKNIEKPINAYKVLLDAADAGKVIGAPTENHRSSRRVRGWLTAALAALVIAASSAGTWYYQSRPDVEPARADEMAFTLPDKPSLAVLPFSNFSGDPAEERLSDGITENLITMLSKVPELFVIARNSTFTYKGKAVKVQRVAEDLGVQYVLEGSFQRQDDRVRVIAQLIDALSGRHVWTERYDRTIEDIFVLQDDIALHVATALRGLLKQGERGGVGQPPTDSLEAWNLHLEGESHFQQWSGEGMAKARELWSRAVEIDPDFVAAWTDIGWTHWADIRFAWTPSPEKSMRQAYQAAERALSIDPASAGAYSLLEGLALIEGRHDDALAYGEKAISLNPNNADYIASHAIVQYFAGQPEAAERSVKRAMRLNPSYPIWYLLPLEEAYRLTGRYDKAIETIQEELRRLDHFFTRTRLALYYAQSGQDDRARAEIERVLQINPDMNSTYWANAQYFKDSGQTERDLSDLRRVGLPE